MFSETEGLVLESVAGLPLPLRCGWSFLSSVSVLGALVPPDGGVAAITDWALSLGLDPIAALVALTERDLWRISALHVSPRSWKLRKIRLAMSTPSPMASVHLRNSGSKS